MTLDDNERKQRHPTNSFFAWEKHNLGRNGN